MECKENTTVPRHDKRVINTVRQSSKDSFILYTDYKQHIELLTDEEAGQLFRALFEFVEAGTIPPFTGQLKMCFSFISAQIRRDKEKYIDICNKRAEAGRIGGKQKQANLANANYDKQKQANLTDNDTVNVSDSDSDTVIKNNICELLNTGKYMAGNKGRLKPGGFYGYNELLELGITPEDMQQVAEELAQTGQGVDWYEFTKILKNRKAKGEL